MSGSRDRPRDRLRGPSGATLARLPWALGVIVGGLLGGLACGPGCAPAPRSLSPESGDEAAGEGAGPAEVARPRPPKEARTANPDRRGFTAQPDYDGEAARLREFVEPRLPPAGGVEPEAACAAMFAATDRFYTAIERAPARQAEVLAALQATRAADLAACVRETSPRAAACVAQLLGDRSAELPWLLDQCSRAYPQGPTRE